MKLAFAIALAAGVSGLDGLLLPLEGAEGRFDG